MALSCGDNWFRGTMRQGMDATNAVDAYDLAVEFVTKRIKQHVAEFVRTLECPTGQGCSEKQYDDRWLTITVRRLRGEPSRRIRGYYWIEIAAEYRFMVRCKPAWEEMPPPPPPVPDPDPPVTTGGTGTGTHGNTPDAPPPECEDPDPPIVLPVGHRITDVWEVDAPPGGDITGVPGFVEWREAGPGEGLDAILLGAAQACGENCEPYFEPEPEFDIERQDLGTRFRLWFKLTNEVRIRCRPR